MWGMDIHETNIHAHKNITLAYLSVMCLSLKSELWILCCFIFSFPLTLLKESIILLEWIHFKKCVPLGWDMQAPAFCGSVLGLENWTKSCLIRLERQKAQWPRVLTVEYRTALRGRNVRWERAQLSAGLSTHGGGGEMQRGKLS